MSATNTINPNPVSIIVILGFIGTMRRMHILKCLQNKSINVRIDLNL